MGSPLRLTFGRETPSPAKADRSWRLVVGEFEAAEAAMSRFRDDERADRLQPRGRFGRGGVPIEASSRGDRCGRSGPSADRRRVRPTGAARPRSARLPGGDHPRARVKRCGPGRPVGRTDRRAARASRPVHRAPDRSRWDRQGPHPPLGGGARSIGRARPISCSRPVATWSRADRDPERRRLADRDRGPGRRRRPLAVIEVEDRRVATSSIRVHRWIRRSAGRPSPARPADRRAGRRRARGGHRRRVGSRLGRGLVEGPVRRRPNRDRATRRERAGWRPGG